MRRFLRRPLRAALLALPLFAGMAGAEPPPAPPADIPLTPAQETHYRELLYTLRCLVCQNESLLDSDAPLAADLRNKVRARIARGESDTQIKKYLTDRYGDFVLYRPPLQANTLLLWGGPFLLALIGLITLVSYTRRTHRRAVPCAVDPEALRRLLEEEPGAPRAPTQEDRSC